MMIRCFNSNRYNSEFKKGDDDRRNISFQFQQVQFREKNVNRSKDYYDVSIPIGTIQRRKRVLSSHAREVSIPIGTIQSCNSLVALLSLLVFQFQQVQFRASLSIIVHTSFTMFQFQQVQFRDSANKAPVGKLIVSIPIGTIQSQMNKDRFRLIVRFNSNRYNSEATCSIVFFIIPMFQFQQVQFRANKRITLAHLSSGFNSNRYNSEQSPLSSCQAYQQFQFQQVQFRVKLQLFVIVTDSVFQFQQVQFREIYNHVAQSKLIVSIPIGTIQRG